MTLPTISAPTRAYLRTFDLTAVVLTRDGRLTSTCDPSGRDASAVWWCRATDVGRLVKAARKTGDLVGAAQRLGIVVTEHTTVMARATAAVEKIEQRLAQAQRNGDLGFINREFKRRRLEAAAQGRLSQAIRRRGQGRSTRLRQQWRATCRQVSLITSSGSDPLRGAYVPAVSGKNCSRTTRWRLTARSIASISFCFGTGL